MGRPVVHWEFWTRDPEKISKFYSEVFDWEIQFIPELNYRMVETGSEAGIKGGIMEPQEGPLPAKLAFYIDVDDLEKYCEKIKQAGGKILMERMEIPGVGALALFEDPDGRVLGMWLQNRES
ncbi:MAG: VOC family protein [Calditrichaeota bacterium]|nr:MAG: VOC family protein [Calditrichota bacterium]